jgi:hypothetical protein
MPLVSVREEGNISLPEKMTDIPAWCRLIAAKVNQIMRGKTNNVGEVTLNASSTTTNVTVPVGVFGDKTVFLFDPTTSTAATAFGSGSMYVSARNPDLGTYTITHPNTADANKTFRVAYVG